MARFFSKSKSCWSLICSSFGFCNVKFISLFFCFVYEATLERRIGWFQSLTLFEVLIVFSATLAYEQVSHPANPLYLPFHVEIRRLQVRKMENPNNAFSSRWTFVSLVCPKLLWPLFSSPFLIVHMGWKIKATTVKTSKSRGLTKEFCSFNKLNLFFVNSKNLLWQKCY